MRKAKTYHHGDLRAEVLRLALAELEHGPPEALTVREVARQAGVTSMAIYRHFKDRDALLGALAEVGFADLGARMHDVEHAKSAKAALVAIGTIYVGFAVERPGLFQLMYGGKPPNTPTPAAGEPPHAAYAALGQRIAALVPPAKRDIAFLACWSLVHGLATLLVTQRLRESVGDPAELAERVCRFFAGAFE